MQISIRDIFQKLLKKILLLNGSVNNNIQFVFLVSEMIEKGTIIV